MSVLEHPSVLSPAYRRYVVWLGATAALQMAWSMGIFVISVRPPLIVAHIISPRFDPGIVYSIYSGVHALYVMIGTGFSVLLRSRGWMRAAAFASAVPGPGVFFGAVQIPVAIYIYRSMNEPRWGNFFRWREMH